ncbi:unnamed protein product [Cuscuta epithymum]|uniref:Uncharacterized protein n=1 Tax=Cuscuta epithymum TaxID=186058 RepID=A0AAV0EWU9_9ASTE|nr:unnamed protein product [Cuscuta epithymum]
MTRQIVLSPSFLEKQQTLLAVDPEASSTVRGGGHKRRPSFGEVAGETAADCAAVSCCCPCILVNLVVLAVYKVPTGLCRKALRIRRRRSRLLSTDRWPQRQFSFNDGSELQIYHLSASTPAAAASSLESDKAVIELEKEMWEKFYGAGFWRSFSQRSDITDLSR